MDVVIPILFVLMQRPPCSLESIASLACSAHHGNREILSHTLATVMCDVEDICLENAVYESACPSPCSHVVQNDFWIIFHNSKFLRWMTRVHQRSEENSLPFLLCFFDDFFISLSFRFPSSFYTTDLSLLSVKRQLYVLQVQRVKRSRGEWALCPLLGQKHGPQAAGTLPGPGRKQQ